MKELIKNILPQAQDSLLNDIVLTLENIRSRLLSYYSKAIQEYFKYLNQTSKDEKS